MQLAFGYLLPCSISLWLELKSRSAYIAQYQSTRERQGLARLPLAERCSSAGALALHVAGTAHTPAPLLPTVPCHPHKHLAVAPLHCTCRLWQAGGLLSRHRLWQVPLGLLLPWRLAELAAAAASPDALVHKT